MKAFILLILIQLINASAANSFIAKSEQEVNLSGTLHGGIVAIGGETTGWELAYSKNGLRSTIEVDMEAIKKAIIFDGEKVTISGELGVKNHLERGAVRILTAKTVVPGKPDNRRDGDKINEMKDLRVEKSVFVDATREKPIVLKFSEDGMKYFGKEALAKISKAVDFEKQIVLVFAWKGSGQDRLTFASPEVHPEQINFSYKPGRTKDLRPHVKIFVLRSDVKWTVN